MRAHGLRRMISLPLEEATAVKLEKLAEEAGVNYTLLARCFLALALGCQPDLAIGRGRNQKELQRANDFLVARWPKVASKFLPCKHLVSVSHSVYDATRKDA